MPTYEYYCRACKHPFSVREKMDAHDPQHATCPRCKSGDVERVITGFYARTPRKS